MEKIEIQKLVNEHSSFTVMLNELIKSLLNSYNIKFHIVESRTKTAESLNEKISRKNIKSVNEEITDLSGIRIILYYQDDVDKVSKLIKENFIIDKENSINKAELYDSNQFGYLSIHYIVKLNNNRTELPEWKNFSFLKAEIQVRTVLQHSWASISHELSYKKGYEIPKELERKLFRLASLFELADEQFLKIRDEHEDLNSTIKKLTKSNKLNQLEINRLTLKYSLSKPKGIYKEIIELGYKLGFEEFDESSAFDYDDDDVDFQQYYYSEIIIVTKILGIKSLIEFEEKLKTNIKLIGKVFSDLMVESFGWQAGNTFLNLIASMTLLSSNELDLFSQKSGWDNENFQNVANAIIANKEIM